MKKFAVIVAGGSGQRMGADLPKQFLRLQNKPLLQHTIEAFVAAYNDVAILLVLPPAHLTRGQQLIDEINEQRRVQVVAGGALRFHSVLNGLRAIMEPAIIFVHDGVRCLVTTDLIKRCYEQALLMGSAIPAVPATDTLRIEEGNTNTLLDRTKVRIIQTPQTFRSEIIIPAFEQASNDSFTDEASVVEAFGTPVHLIEGEYSNLKITRPIDLCVAENILQERSLQ